MASLTSAVNVPTACRIASARHSLASSARLSPQRQLRAMSRREFATPFACSDSLRICRPLVFLYCSSASTARHRGLSTADLRFAQSAIPGTSATALHL